MIDGNGKRNCQLAFELQNSHICEKRSKQESNKNKMRCTFVYPAVNKVV